MQRDKLLHFALGIIAILCALAALIIHTFFGVGACLAYTTTMVGLLYEGQQWVRKEGQVELLDAVATASPGWLAWGALIVKDLI
jgi:hypothetical protein